MYIDVSDLTYKQWVTYRKNYIGGSDMATVFGLNPYQSKLELYHEKVGVISKTGKETEATYGGHVQEPHIIDNYWKYHDMDNPDPEVMIANAVDKKPLRHARKVKDSMMYDPKFPHIKINIDGFIQNTRFEKAPRGLLEIKSGLSRVWDTYDAGIPAFYIIQTQTYLLVTGLKYAEIGVLLDGRFFKCFPFEANKAIQDKILTDSAEFWDLIQEGRLIWDDPELSEHEKLQHLSALEPPIDGGAALDKYLKERFRSEYKAGQMIIDQATLQLGMDYLASQVALNQKDEAKRVFSNAIRKVFLDNKVDEIISKAGRVVMSYRKTSADSSPRLMVNKKPIKELTEELAQ